jgi:hypothetical protein
MTTQKQLITLFIDKHGYKIFNVIAPQLYTPVMIGRWLTCDRHLQVIIHEGLLAFLGEDMPSD